MTVPARSAPRAAARSSTRCGAAPCRRQVLTCSRSGWNGSRPPSTTSSSGVAAGRSTFKAVRGEYGSGKTFFARWLAERAKRRGMAAAEIQISETETPLHRLETVYRRLVEQLSTAAYPPSALREIVDAWFYTLEEDVLAEGDDRQPEDAEALAKGVDTLLERRLADVARTTPAFAAALRAYRHATLAGDHGRPRESLIAWIGGQPNVRGLGPPRRRRPGRPGPLRRARLPAGAADDPARLAAIPGFSSSSTRSRPCSGCAPTYATRA